MGEDGRGREDPARARDNRVAGIIVGVVRSRIGLRAEGLIVPGGRIVADEVTSPRRPCDLGLAVPVTAAYIISASWWCPRSRNGRRASGPHMFIFYYACSRKSVLDVPRARPFAASAIRAAAVQHDDADWKYALPRFVPFA